MSGLFSTFNVAKRGIFTQQKALDVTSHNISNVKTEGFSRQRAEIETTRPHPMPSLNSAAEAGQIGTGATVSSIKRIRDDFLDYQVRQQKTIYGEYSGRDKFLSQVENILNEPSENAISKLVTNFFNAWETLASQPQTSNSRTVVTQQSIALAKELNHTFKQLTELQNNADEIIRQSTYEVNNMLEQLDKLNQQIISVRVSGQEPNDLMDKRDLLIDNLSEKFGISIDKRNFEGIDLKPIVTKGEEKLLKDQIYLVRSNPNEEVSRFSYITKIENTDVNNIPKVDPATGEYEYSYRATYYKYGDTLSEINRNVIDITVKVKGIPGNNNDGKELAERIVKDKINEKMGEVLQSRMIWANRDGDAMAKNSISVALDVSSLKGTGVNEWNNKSYTQLSADLNNSFKNAWDGLDENLYLFKPQSGEFKGYASVHKDIEEHKDNLNKMAKALAFSVNAIHSGQTSIGKPAGKTVTTLTDEVDGDYMPFFVNGEEAKKYYQKDGVRTTLINKANTADIYNNLNMVLDAEKDITAENIAVNEVIVDDVMQIKTRTNDNKYASTYDNQEDGTGDGERALQIAMLRNKLIKVQDISKGSLRKDLFNGGNQLSGDNKMVFENYKDGMTVDNCFKNIVNTVGIQEQQAKRTVANQKNLLNSYKQSRSSVSGVSLDEETTNLVAYQHAYQANAKVISVVDELLDVIINGLKR